MLPDDLLDWILGELDKIEHVEVVRIGTRTPVVLPFRITDKLVGMLKKHKVIWINTHFNHPKEFTASSREAFASPGLVTCVSATEAIAMTEIAPIGSAFPMIAAIVPIKSAKSCHAFS